jgi:hypothetical protein
MASFFQGTDPDIDPGSAQESAQLAQEWAIKLDGPVSGTDYSSQYHAQQAAASAAEAAASASLALAAADALQTLGLGDLVDVDVPAPLDGDTLTFVAANGKWEAVT